MIKFILGMIAGIVLILTLQMVVDKLTEDQEDNEATIQELMTRQNKKEMK